MAAQADISVSSRKRVLVVSDSLVFSAGTQEDPAWKMATALSLDHDVILAVPRVSKARHSRFAVVFYNRRNIGLLARDSDVVILSPAVLKENPSLAEKGPLAAASLQALRTGAFTGRALGPDLETSGLGELLVLRPEPRKTGKAGLRQYLGRLRHRLRRALQWKPLY